MRKPNFRICENKDAVQRFAVSAQLISASVFAIWIVKSLFYLNPKFQASSHLLWLYSSVCVGPGRNSRRPIFSQQGSNHMHVFFHPFSNFDRYNHHIIVNTTSPAAWPLFSKYQNLIHVARKSVFEFPTLSFTNRAAQPHNMARGLNFRFRKKGCAIYIPKTEALISCAVTV